MKPLEIPFIVIGIFLLFTIIREFFTWYWKINEISAKQTAANELLKEQNQLISKNNELLEKFVDDFTNK